MTLALGKRRWIWGGGYDVILLNTNTKFWYWLWPPRPLAWFDRKDHAYRFMQMLLADKGALK